MGWSEKGKKDSKLERIELIVDNLIEELPRILGIPEEAVNNRGRVKKELRGKMIEFLTLLLEKDEE